MFESDFSLGEGDQNNFLSSYSNSKHKTDKKRKYENKSIDKKLPNLHSIHKGKINGIKDFGAFIKLDNYELNGLILKRHLTSYKIDNISDVVDIGEQVYVKVS